MAFTYSPSLGKKFALTRAVMEIYRPLKVSKLQIRRLMIAFMNFTCRTFHLRRIVTKFAPAPMLTLTHFQTGKIIIFVSSWSARGVKDVKHGNLNVLTCNLRFLSTRTIPWGDSIYSMEQIDIITSRFDYRPLRCWWRCFIFLPLWNST